MGYMNWYIFVGGKSPPALHDCYFGVREDNVFLANGPIPSWSSQNDLLLFASSTLGHYFHHTTSKRMPYKIPAGLFASPLSFHPSAAVVQQF